MYNASNDAKSNYLKLSLLKSGGAAVVHVSRQNEVRNC